MADLSARDELIGALCEERAYCTHAANYMADAYRAQVRAEAFAEAATAVLLDTKHISYGSATDYAERHAALLRSLATT